MLVLDRKQRALRTLVSLLADVVCDPQDNQNHDRRERRQEQSMVEVGADHARRRHEEPNVHVDKGELGNEIVVHLRIRVTSDGSKLAQGIMAREGGEQCKQLALRPYLHLTRK